MRAFHLVDSYYTEALKNLPPARQHAQLFSRKNILTFNTAMKLNEPLFCSEPLLDLPATKANTQLEKIRALAAYPAPLITVFRTSGQPIAGSLRIEMVRCFDFVYSVSPWCMPFPSMRWYRSFPEFKNENRSWTDREYDVCFVGRPGSRKKPTWIAAVLNNYPDAALAITLCGPSGMPIYKVCKAWAIEPLRNPPREEIGAIFNSSKFLIHPTDSGKFPYHALENSVLEGLACNCPPILNAVYCTARYKDYPAQLSSINDARSFVLSQTLWEDCIAFMENVDAVNHSCRTIKQLRDILNSQTYLVDPFRARRCKQVIRHIQAGEHIFPSMASYKHGPFYKVRADKTMDFEEVEYA